MNLQELTKMTFNSLSKIENDINDIKNEAEDLNNLLEQLKNDADLIERLKHI